MQIVRSAAAMALVGMVASLPAPDATTKLDPSMIAALKALGKSPGDLRHPGSVPNPRFKAGTDLLPGIENIVMLMMENHSFDNIWGTLDRPDADGYTFDKDGKPVFTQRYANGTIQHLYAMPKTCTSADNGPTQNWLSSHTQYDNGSMDGFVVGGGYKPISMAYMTPEQLPFTHSLGETFPIGDRFFSSVLGQTWPNRMYLIAGTSMGAVNTGQNITGFNPPSGTIFNSLDKYGVSWTSYWDEPNGQNTLDLYGIPNNPTRITHQKPFDAFFSDAAAGKLRQFSFIDYNFTTQSQENPQNMVVGEAMVYDIVMALGASPQWEKTLLIINYDEHGGYFDHVPPPPAFAPDNIQPIPPPGSGYLQYEGYRRYGFRVPSVVISPWAKKNHVSHLVYDHTSVLATLQRKWNLPALTMRDANALDLLDFIDLESLERKRPNFPDIKALGLRRPGNTTQALECTPEDPGVIPPPDSVQPPGRTPKHH